MIKVCFSYVKMYQYLKEYNKFIEAELILRCIILILCDGQGCPVMNLCNVYIVCSRPVIFTLQLESFQSFLIIAVHSGLNLIKCV